MEYGANTQSHNLAILCIVSSLIIFIRFILRQVGGEASSGKGVVGLEVLDRV